MADVDAETKRSVALGFLKSYSAGVLATVSRDGAPHASVVYYTSDDDFSVYFMTLIASRKYAAIQANPNVAFVVGRQDAPQTLQIEGVATQLKANDELMGRKLPELLQRLTSNATYFAPITKMNPSDLVVIWVRPTWIRWSDFATTSSGNENVFIDIPPRQGEID